MAKDWTKLYKKYKGLWVALATDEETVIASGKTLKETLSKAKRRNEQSPSMFRVPEKEMVYAGNL